jgi:hypothetical protein
LWRRDPAGCGGRERRRSARLCPAVGLDGLSRDLHLAGGAGRRAGGNARAA